MAETGQLIGGTLPLAYSLTDSSQEVPPGEVCLESPVRQGGPPGEVEAGVSDGQVSFI